MSSSQDKNLPATAKRLSKARSDGQVPHSRDLSSLGLLGGGSVLLLLLAPEGFAHLQSALQRQLRFDHEALQRPAMEIERLHGITLDGLLVYLPLGAVVMLVPVLLAYLTGGWALSTTPMTPNLNKLSPLAGMKRLFSRYHLFETFKVLVMTVLLGWIAWAFLVAHFHPFATLLMQPLEGALAQLANWIGMGVGFLLLALALMAIADVPLQKFLHRYRLRMSREEVKREYRDAEGDPQIKGKRRRRQRELAQRNSVASVPRADLVVMNPTHFAVAIQYDDATMRAPRVIAKGADLIAFMIRDVAKAHQIPVLQAPMLARALYAHTEIDDEVPSALYTAVAQVLAYVYQVKAARDGRAKMPASMPVPDVPPELDPQYRRRPRPAGAA